MPARPAFTLIELSMAMVIGVIVVFAAMGMFQAIDRADAIADVRADEMAQLRRTQAVASRAMGSLLVMSRDDQRRAESALKARDRAERGMLEGDEVGGDQGGGGDPITGDDFIAALEETLSQYQPRLILEQDPRLSDARMTRRVRIGDTALGEPQTRSPQRLELALSAPCVIPSYEDERRRYRIAQLGLAPIDIGSSVDAMGAVRGAFVFRDERRVNELGLRIFSLWWQPIAGDRTSAMEFEAARLDPAMIDGSVLLMDELVWGQWRFYAEKQWHEQFMVRGELDLAAYAELELTTAQNHTVSWLFELAWTIGVEPEDEADAGEGDAEAADAGSQTGQGGRTTETGGAPAGGSAGQGVMN